jgi:branched-chain amino acid transport system ATP-binding protein
VVERGIALVPEGRGIFGDLTVRENLLLGANPARARDEEGANLDRLVRCFPKLQERAGQVVRTMSGASSRWSPSAGR